MRAVAVHDARFDRWLTATPSVDVPVRVVTEAPGRPRRLLRPARPRCGRTGPAYATAPLPRDRPDPTTERVPEHTASHLYDERWMFHGPAFQGVTELTAIGDRHVRGVITTPPAPGSLLDNVGQILGYWIMSTRTERTVVFPVGMREMRFYGPHPRPGTEVDCLVRITLAHRHRARMRRTAPRSTARWRAELTGWQDRRFDNDPRDQAGRALPRTQHALRGPPRRPDPAARALARPRLPRPHHAQLPEQRGAFAVRGASAARSPAVAAAGRIALKDAVRQWLWGHGEGPVFPAEIRVHNDESGRPYVTGLHGRTLPPLDVSLAHAAEAAVAIVRPHSPNPGPESTSRKSSSGTPPPSPPLSARTNSPCCKPS
ncbi:polyketide synthase dehydratase domain-containing protein [Streptomyces sp. L7]